MTFGNASCHIVILEERIHCPQHFTSSNLTYIEPMKSKSSNRLLFLALAVTLQSASAADQYWNPAGLNGNWGDSNWAATSGGVASAPWTAGNNAFFDQAGTYTVNLLAAQTADAVNVTAGNVTFTGTATVGMVPGTAVSSNSVSIAAAATLSTTGDIIAKNGETPVIVNGTLFLSAPSSGGHYIQPAGNGTIKGTVRYSHTATFDGAIVDVTTPALVRSAISWNGGAPGTLTLSGDNSGMSGDILLSIGGSTIIANSANAISANSELRLEGGANSVLVELAFGDLTRVWATGANATGQGGMHWNGSNGGFYATGADRNLTFYTDLTGTTPASIVWGNNGIDATAVVLGAAAATNTITWTNDIDLNAGNRTINVGDGSADVDAVLSGVISGLTTSKLTKSGPGTLLLSNANTHAGGTAIANSSGVDSVLRITNSAALGTGNLTIGGGGNTDQSRLEISGGLTIANYIAGFASRSNDAPNIVNLDGNSTISSAITSGGGGDRTTFQSDSGKLTFTGSFSGRQLNLMGEGNGQFSNNSFTLTKGLVKSGNGTWILKGTANYSDTTTISGGSLVAQRTTQLALGTGDVSISDGANLTITDHAGSGQLAYANNIVLGGSGINGSGALSFYNSGGFDMSGTIAIAGGTTFRTDPVGQSGAVSFTNVISGTDGLTLFAQNSNALGKPIIAFSGASTYSGDTVITSSGTNTTPFMVTLTGGDDRLPNGTNLIFGGTPAGSPVGTFDKSTTLALDGISQEIAGISNANAGTYRVVGASSTAATLVVNNASDGTFDGIIGGAGANQNNLGLTKNGAGMLTLTGANSYSGNTTVINGTLTLNTPAFGSSSTVTIGTAAASAAVLKLPNSGTSTVASLVIDGVAQTVGMTYDSGNSGGAISGSGKILVAGAPAASYATWASAFTSPPLSNTAPTADPDFDGIPNAVEYVTGSDPRVSSLANLPTSSISGGNLVFTFNRVDSSETPDVSLVVQTSTNLADWATQPSYTIGADTASSTLGVTVAENGAAADTITVKIPVATKGFARLRVITTP